MRRRFLSAAGLTAIAGLLMGAKGCGAGSKYGLSGTLEVGAGRVRADYEYDGSQGKRNVQGYLQWKPVAGPGTKWNMEDASAARSDEFSHTARGSVRAIKDKGFWRLVVTSADENGEPVGYWASHTYYVRGGAPNPGD